MRPLLPLFLILLASVASADNRDLTKDFERVLFPIWTDVFNVPGVSGSQWSAVVTINNPTSRPIAVFPIVTEYGRYLQSLQPRTSWSMTFISNTYLGGSEPGLGEMAYVPRADADSLVYNDSIVSPVLAEVPVVRERDLRTTSIALAGVPLDPGFRLMLRMYDPFRTANARFAVHFWAEWRVPNANAAAYSSQAPALLGSTEVTLVDPPQLQSDPDLEPGYAELPIGREMLSNVPPWSRNIAVEVEPLTPGVRFWAFITATRNDSQQVLTITPH
jgi:hypothetical protein